MYNCGFSFIILLNIIICMAELLKKLSVYCFSKRRQNSIHHTDGSLAFFAMIFFWDFSAGVSLINGIKVYSHAVDNRNSEKLDALPIFAGLWNC